MKKVLNFLKKHKVFSAITIGGMIASIVFITKKSKGNYFISISEDLSKDEKLVKALIESAEEYLRLNPGENLYISLN